MTYSTDALLEDARARIEALEAALREKEDGWRDISTYDTKHGPDIVLVCYEGGHVTVAEYLEYCVGGPDDHQTWDPYVYPRNKNNEPMMHEWPTHWRPLPSPPLAQEEKAAEDDGHGNARDDGDDSAKAKTLMQAVEEACDAALAELGR